MNTFEEKLMQKVESAASLEYPHVHHHEDGDCIELLLSGESYKAVRIDDLMTVYMHRETKKPVGALLKGVNKFTNQLKQTLPGASVDLTGQNVSLEYILSAGMWRTDGDEEVYKIYIELREVAKEKNIRVDLAACV